MRISLILLVCLLAPAAIALAEDKPAAAAPTSGNPRSAVTEGAYERQKDILLRSAEKMPEENYGFKPVESVRSFGQILGHTADAQYLFCSIVLGETNPAPKVEQTKTSKADLIAALKTAFAYCDKAYGGMTDASAPQMAKLFGRDIPKLGVLTINNMHNMEHYGNLSTYLRIKNLVPPTSESGGSPMPPPKK
jgi:uncharacterized damage-inducible protein DinB